jgi:L-lactate dehydrogenase complex protein LldG
MSAREEILARVRAATTDLIGVPVPPPPFAPVGGADLVSLFAERVADYRADVRVVTAGELPGAIAAALSRNGAREVVTPAGLDPTWVGAADGIRALDARTVRLSGPVLALWRCGVAGPTRGAGDRG